MGAAKELAFNEDVRTQMLINVGVPAVQSVC